MLPHRSGRCHSFLHPGAGDKELTLSSVNLLSQRMALNSFQLFLSQIQSAPEVLKIRVLQIVFDILMVHEGEFLGKGGSNVSCVQVPFLARILINTSPGR